MPSIDINGMIWSAFEFLLGKILGKLLDRVLDLYLQAIDVLFNFDPIDLNAEWWRSTYATAFWYGLAFSIPVGVIYAVVHVYKQSSGSKNALTALTLFGKVFFFGALAPVVYGFLLKISGSFTDAARLGHEPAELKSSVEVFKNLGILLNLPYANWMLILSFLMAVEMFVLSYFTYLIGIGAALFYVVKDAGSIGRWLWRKTSTMAIVVLIARPLMVLIQTIGYLTGKNVNQNSSLSFIAPGALVVCIFLSVCVYIPWGLMKSTGQWVDAQIKGGTLDKVGKTNATTTVKPPSSGGGRSNISRAAELGAEHMLDVRTAKIKVGAEAAARAAGSSGSTGSGGGGGPAIGSMVVKAAAAAYPPAATAVKVAAVAGQVAGASKTPPPPTPPTRPPRGGP